MWSGTVLDALHIYILKFVCYTMVVAGFWVIDYVGDFVFQFIDTWILQTQPTGEK